MRAPADSVTVVIAGAGPCSRDRAAGRPAMDARLRIVGVVPDPRRAVGAVETLRPNVVLLDVGSLQDTDLAAVAQLARHAAVLVLMDGADPQSLHLAVRAGATGYLIRGQFEADELSAALLAAARGEPRLGQPAIDALVRLVRDLPDPDRCSPSPRADRLSPREVEIMGYIARGAANSDIARQLYLSEKTVRNHVNHIYAKLGVRNRAQAMASWLGTDAQDRLPAR
jgi:DNA-binding NarL/FixJ family response regulator